MSEIKFRLVDGEPVCCSEHCPRFETCTLVLQGTNACIPGLRQQRDEAIEVAEFLAMPNKELVRFVTLVRDLTNHEPRSDGEARIYNRATALIKVMRSISHG